MSDKLLSIAITVGILAALALWVPALDLCKRFILKHGKHRKLRQSHVRQIDKPRKPAAI